MHLALLAVRPLPISPNDDIDFLQLPILPTIVSNRIDVKASYPHGVGLPIVGVGESAVPVCRTGFSDKELLPKAK